MTRPAVLLTIGLVATATLAACSDANQPADPLETTGAYAAFKTRQCQQPLPDNLITLPIAPSAARVDLGTPVFTNPTSVTNPLFPISNLSQVVLVGFVVGRPFRAETTLLPGSQSINLGDRKVKVLTSQYVAYLDGRIHETALDWYGQDDNGAVWYFGEDVANYEDGEIADTDGTWLACKDGPVAMIMPALPSVGNVYRPENIFPTVFEEVTVTQAGVAVSGPIGPVSGAIVGSELHLDGSREDKTFAPGYGEFSTGSGADVEALALAIPIDASPLPAPAELRTLLRGSRRVFNAAATGDWTSASGIVGTMNSAWATYQAGVVPLLLRPLMVDALNQLSQAVAAHDRDASRQFALDVSKTGLDLLLRHNSRIAVDFARLDLWARQLIVDTETEEEGGAASDLAILRTILFRLTDVGDKRDRKDVKSVQHHLGSIQKASDRESSADVLDGVRRLQSVLSDRIRAQED